MLTAMAMPARPGKFLHTLDAGFHRHNGKSPMPKERWVSAQTASTLRVLL
jgi:hypothetical protein